MGIIIAKFKGKKSTLEILEKLENEIISIQEFSRATENTKKKLGRFIGLALFTYAVLAIVLAFYQHKISSNHKLLYIVPLVAFPLVIYGVKTFLSWYYSQKIRKNQLKLVKLKAEKKKILEKVEETETYKVAKVILEKFGEPSNESSPGFKDATSVVKSKIIDSKIISQKPLLGLRQRSMEPMITKTRLSFGSQLETPMGRASAVDNRTVPGYSVTPNGASRVQPPTSALQIPRAILPKSRNILDKMFDYLVGDGPSNRYALICKSCSNHNGMVFKEEFEYLSFKCCYCGFFNPSLKKRPSGPQLKPTISQPVADTSESSDSDLSSVESDQVFTRTGITEETVDNGNLFGPVPRKSTDGELLDQVEKTASEVQDPRDSPVTLMEENESNTNPFEESKHQLQVRVNPFSDDSEPEISPEAPNFEAQEKED